MKIFHVLQRREKYYPETQVIIVVGCKLYGSDKRKVKEDGSILSLL